MEVSFVGRERYLTELGKAFKKYPIISVCGLKTVGKSRLVSEFLTSTTSKHDSKNMHIIQIDMHHHGDRESLYSAVCSNLEISPNIDATKTDDWIKHVVLSLQKDIDRRHVFVFDNAEDAVEERLYRGFLSLLHMMVKHCRNVKVIVTSTTSILFSTMGRSHYPIQLTPLLTMESRELLLNVTRGLEIEAKDLDTMVELSDGLPLLLMMIGSELMDKERGISPRQMVELLSEFRLEATSPECYPPERRAAEVYTKFIQRLSEIHQSRLAILNFIPGTFNVDEAKEMLDLDTVAVTKLETIQPMFRRHVMYSQQKWRFDIHGILRECMNTFPKLKNLPEIQTRYYRLFSEVMAEVCEKFGTAEYTKAVAEFSVEQPNFVKLLDEVSNSTQTNYAFFIHVARKCTHLLEQYMTGMSEQFYSGCLTLADRYGKDLDKAAVYIAIGSLSTNGKGSFVMGEKNYRLALSLMERQGKSRDLTSLYQRMGWNLHNQGRYFESLRYLEKALDMSSTGGSEYRDVMIETLTNLGTVNNWMGDYEHAKKCTLRVMHERKAMHGENHPNYASCLNQMGLISDQLGEPDEAMTYFAKALKVKKNSKASVHSITISLNNMANKYREKGRFEEAKKFLDEAMSEINELDQKNEGGVSLTYNSYGKLYKDMEVWDKAEDNYKWAMDIRKTIMPRSVPYVWTVLQLARVRVCRNKYKSAIGILEEILKDKEHVLETMPHNDFVLEALKTKSEIYLERGNMDSYKDSLNEIQLEMARLLNIYMEKENYKKYEKLSTEWEEVKRKIESM